jgi:hypothetical protein
VSAPGAYDAAHAAIRRAMLASRQPGDRCARCGRPLPADDRKVDLGHDDDRPGAYKGLECSKCNRSAGGRKGNARKRQLKQYRQGTAATVAEVAVAVEISADRTHASLVTAGYLEGDLILVSLERYLEYRDSGELVAAVVDLGMSRSVVAVVVDGHAPGATAIRPLEQARIRVTCPSSSDVTIAHGGFLDVLAAGRLRHQGQPELTGAMRAMEQRRLGGSSAPERRSAQTDIGPGVAAELACWGLETLPRTVDPFAVLGR